MPSQGISIPADLKSAKVKIEFGHTIVAELDTEAGTIIAGFRESFQVSEAEWYGMMMLGPDLASELRTENTAKTALEKVLTADFENGFENRIHAVVINFDLAYLAFGEGLIVENHLEPAENGLSQGRILLNGRVWKLLVDDREYVLGTTFSFATVDTDLKVVE